MTLYKDSPILNDINHIKNNITIVSKEDLNISDELIWKKARKSKEVPNINNIYYEEFITRLITLLCNKYTFLDEDDFKYDIDGDNTYFTYDPNGYEFYMFTEFDEFQRMIIRENQKYNELLTYKNIESLSNIDIINASIHEHLKYNHVSDAEDIDYIKNNIIYEDYQILLDYIPTQFTKDLYKYIESSIHKPNNTFDTLDDALSHYESRLGKHDSALITIDNDNVLLCGTPLAYDDFIDSHIYELLLKLNKHTHMFEQEDVSDLYDLSKQITEYIDDLIYKETKIIVEYIDTEY